MLGNFAVWFSVDQFTVTKQYFNNDFKLPSHYEHARSNDGSSNSSKIDNVATSYFF